MNFFFSRRQLGHPYHLLLLIAPVIINDDANNNNNQLKQVDREKKKIRKWSLLN